MIVIENCESNAHYPEADGPEMDHTKSEAQEDHCTDIEAAHHKQMLDSSELKAIVESLLFVSHEPVTSDRLAVVLDVSPSETRQALIQLRQEFDQSARGLQVVEVAGGFQLSTRPEHAFWIKQFGKSKSAPKLSRSALESLAIIAYKQPVVRAEIEQIRGVETSGVLRTLLERKLVRIVGRKDAPGRPIMYGTTKYFLQHFGLRDLAELPPLREFSDLGEPEQALLPIEEEGIMVGESKAIMPPKPAEHT